MIVTSVFSQLSLLQPTLNLSRKLKPKTLCDLYFIREHLYENIEHKKRITYPKTAIWRYSKEYKSEYPTNSELPIEVVCELYKKYITEFKFKKSEVLNANLQTQKTMV